MVGLRYRESNFVDSEKVINVIRKHFFWKSNICTITGVRIFVVDGSVRGVSSVCRLFPQALPVVNRFQVIRAYANRCIVPPESRSSTMQILLLPFVLVTCVFRRGRCR